VIKTWTEVAARVRLYMLISDLTSLVPQQFSHWLQVRKVCTVYLFYIFLGSPVKNYREKALFFIIAVIKKPLRELMKIDSYRSRS